MRKARTLAIAIAAALLSLAAVGGAAAQTDGENALETAALAAVARRVDAFNARDIDAFLAAHAEDARIFGYPDQLFGEGREHLERTFGPLFARGLGSTEVREQWVQDGVVVSDETVVEDGEPQHVIFIYVVEDGVIASLRLIGSPREDAAGGAAHVSAREQAALAAVARAVDGFNAHDVDAYLAAFAEDLRIYVYPERRLAQERAHLARIFGPSLARGEGAVDVRGRWVLGNVVVTDELRTGEGASERVVVVYTVEDGVIAEYRLIEAESR
jgi:hypothetical protein